MAQASGPCAKCGLVSMQMMGLRKQLDTFKLMIKVNPALSVDTVIQIFEVLIGPEMDPSNLTRKECQDIKKVENKNDDDDHFDPKQIKESILPHDVPQVNQITSNLTPQLPPQLPQNESPPLCQQKSSIFMMDSHPGINENTSPTNSQQQDDDQDQYSLTSTDLCPSNGEETWEKSCRDLLDALYNHKDAHHFIYPINIQDYPDYNQIIKKPMCLGDVRTHLDNGDYLTKDSFHEDIIQIFTNSKIYTPNPSSKIRVISQRLESFYESKIGVLKNSSINLIDGENTKTEIERPRRSPVENKKYGLSSSLPLILTRSKTTGSELLPKNLETPTKMVDKYLSEYRPRDGSTSWQCLDCQKIMSTKSSARLHYRRVHLKERISCKSCDKQFYNSKVLKMHVCNDPNPPKRGRPSRSPLVSPQLTFRQASHSAVDQLLETIKDSHGKWKWKCLKCLKTSMHKGNARQHVRRMHLKFGVHLNAPMDDNDGEPGDTSFGLETHGNFDSVQTATIVQIGDELLIVRNPFPNFNLNVAMGVKVQLKRLQFSDELLDPELDLVSASTMESTKINGNTN